MTLVVDTNAYSAFCRGTESVINAFEEADALIVPSIVAGELYSGFLQGNRREVRTSGEKSQRSWHSGSHQRHLDRRHGPRQRCRLVIMARPSRKRALGVWLNGIRVGIWSIGVSGVHEFRYEDSWLVHAQARPISLSIPLGETVYRGDVVSAFFENLLPDSNDIRQRIRIHYKAASLSAFDLLAEIGRDCVGAIQLLRDEEEPSPIDRIEGRPI